MDWMQCDMIAAVGLTTRWHASSWTILNTKLNASVSVQS